MTNATIPGGGDPNGPGEGISSTHEAMSMTKPSNPTDIAEARKALTKLQMMAIGDSDNMAKVEIASDLGKQIYPALNQLEPISKEMDDLARKVYVPGTWCCAKCGFVLLQSNLNMADGTVTARDEPGTKCPNDGSPMWRRSWQAYATDMANDVERIWEEKQVLTSELDAANARIKTLEEALTTSAETKAAYMGEFQFNFSIWNEQGSEQITFTPNVPWTTIKEIMAAIKSRADSLGRNLCEDCPPIGYSTDITRCDSCPRHARSALRTGNNDGGADERY